METVCMGSTAAVALLKYITHLTVGSLCSNPDLLNEALVVKIEYHSG